jgi:hypothetical protein
MTKNGPLSNSFLRFIRSVINIRTYKVTDTQKKANIMQSCNGIGIEMQARTLKLEWKIDMWNTRAIERFRVVFCSVVCNHWLHPENVKHRQ